MYKINKAGLSVKDSKGNSNWYKMIIVSKTISFINVMVCIE